MAASLDIHPFERARLGAAPFRFVGMSEKVYVAWPGAPEQPAGTCDFCGNGIRYCYNIESADGKRFIVGCDCVKRTDKESLVNATEFERAVAQQKREQARARTRARTAREEERIAQALEAFDQDAEAQDKASKRPHPLEWRAAKGATLLDWIDWMRNNAFHSGRLRVIRVIETLNRKP
jgi:hypothetical protein